MIDPWGNPNNWYQSQVEDLKPCLPRGGDPTSASGRAIIVRWSDMEEGGREMSSTRQWRWMIIDGAMVPRCGARCLIKFIFGGVRIV